MSPIAAELVNATLTDGSYRKHLDALRRRLAKARREAGEILGALGIQPWITPRGGFYLWCRLPDGMDAAELARAALHENLVLAPGNVFCVSQTASEFTRFNVAQMVGPHVFDALARALAITRSTKTVGSPAGS